MQYGLRTFVVTVVIGIFCFAARGDEPVKGRYVRYGNPLSTVMSIAEIEIFSGGKNIIAKHSEYFTQDYLFKLYRGKIRQLVDGKKDTSERHVEFTAPGAGGYSDTAVSYCSLEIDLGKSVPIEKIDIYRANYKYKSYYDLGWRYLLVLDENRKIVSYKVFNVYQGDWRKTEGLWTIVPQPATGVVAGKVVPERNRIWLSEAEFLRDFLGKPIVDLTKDLSEEDKKRLERFEHRDDPEEIKKLGEEFFRLVELDRPELKKVKELVAEKKYAEALDAFKEPFFNTISSAAGKLKMEYTWEYIPDSRDTMRIRDLSNHIYGDKKALTVTKFKPGLLPPSQFTYPFQTRPLLLGYSSTGDEKLLKLWEAMTDDWAMSFQEAADKNPKLRQHFVLTNTETLQKNIQDLAETARERPEFVKELSGATLARFMMPILEEIPVSAWRVWRKCVFNHTFNATGGSWETAMLLKDFKAGARLERELQQQMLRLHTLSQYRDGHLVEVLDEGHFVFGYYEMANLYGELCLTRPKWFTPDREAFMLDLLRQAELAPVRHTSPSGVCSRWVASWKIYFPNFRIRYNPELERIKKGLPVEDSFICSYLQRMSVIQEAEPRAVADTVYGWGPLKNMCDLRRNPKKGVIDLVGKIYHGKPGFLSDFMPYSGAYYFRGGWERDASFLHMLKPAISNDVNYGFLRYYTKGHELFDTTSYRFDDYATPLMSVFATEIDKQVPCDYYGRHPSGSKQSVFTQAVEKPQPMRWFTDDRLDFGEAVYKGIYHNKYRYRRKSPETGEYQLEFEDDPTLINDVTTTRQIFQVRPARLFVQIERVKYASDEETHQNRIPSTLLLTEPGKETKVEFSDGQLRINQKTKTVMSRNVDNPGVTMAWFGQPELEFKQYSVNEDISRFWPQPSLERVFAKRDSKLYGAGWGKGFETLNGLRRTTGRGVFSIWNGKGESVLVGLLYANAPGKSPVTKTTDLSTDDTAGFSAEIYGGNKVVLLTARKIPASLKVDEVMIDGESLLKVEESGREPTFMLLGAENLRIDGKSVSLPSPNMTFDLKDGKIHNPQLIRKPLDPPTINPSINTFVDSTTVSLATDSPDAIIRYTTETPKSRMDDFVREMKRVLKGTSTMEESGERLAISEPEGAKWKVYTGPFKIAKDTLVRARTFRKGIDYVPSIVAAGTDVSVISYGFFHKKAEKPAVAKMPDDLKPGLNYDYLEGRWFKLWTYSDVLPAKKKGTTEKLLDVSMRETDDPFAVRYYGYIKIPTDGVYTFYAPKEYIDNICEPGYDLRVYVDGEEWDLGQIWHGRGQWSVPLKKGFHKFKLIFSDARAKDLENQHVDLLMHYPYAKTTWKGVVPMLDMSGPNLKRGPIPNSWFFRIKEVEK